MYIYDNGIRLAADLDMPSDLPVVPCGDDGSGFRYLDTSDRKVPVCIIIHGFTGWRTERHLMAVSRMMNELGMATLRVDMYGHGESGGSFRDHDLFKWLSNISRAVEYAESLPFAGDIYLCGHSQGGLAVILAGAMLQDKLKAIIPLSPATMLPQMVRSGRFFGRTFTDEVPEEIEIPGKGLRLGGNYARVARMLHVEEAMEQFKKPVLIVHGDADEAVPVHYAEEADEIFENSTCILIHGDSHCFDYHLDLMVDAVREWLLDQLG